MRRIGRIAAGAARSLAAASWSGRDGATYTSATLDASTQAGTTTTIKASLDPNDDATASVRIFAPAERSSTTTQAPGHDARHRSRRIVKALDLAGADLPLEGRSSWRHPGRCAGRIADRVHPDGDADRDVGDGSLGRRADAASSDVPPRSLAPQTAFGPAYIQICLPPPDVPAGTPGRATFGAKVYSAELAVNGVFSAATSGAWICALDAVQPGSRLGEPRRARSRPRP